MYKMTELSDKREANNIGRAEFLEPEIKTFPVNFVGPFN
ncbi:hypothetical protein RIEPE_0021 [Candidatus Riesia pediculicola USDA]|uniref:Uncharacterized protein n=1 Tax=Riesia pediculicola (strain USDA) TaxID=515618 RepID=D4G7J5_RIEPU|nr:hypothetical protein RIEPE_0021 [Candidatus Riesia pediculicola USDA]